MDTPTLLDGPRISPKAGGKPTSLVILVHGYGSNGEDLIGLAPYWQGVLPHTQFVSPNAPERCPGSPGGYQWWALQSLSLTERAEGVRRAAPTLETFIDQELAKAGLAEDRLALVGFSQGTMMALDVGLRRERPVAGILAYSGMIADEAGVTEGLRSKPPVLLIHGDADPVLPIMAFHHAKAVLERQGVPLTTHVSRGLGHSIDQAGLQLGGEFLARVLG